MTSAWAWDVLRRALAAVHLAWVFCRAWLKLGLLPAAPRDHGPTAYRIYVFNEGEGPGFHREVAPMYLNPGTWEQDIRDLTGWEAFRVEVRYTFRHKKYRMVLHPGDACVFPPYKEPAAPACRLPKGVLSARLQGRPGSDIDTDVTARVMKYQGPRGDFHAGLGLHVRVHEMFPFDDNVDNGARFTHLRIMDTMARLHDLPFASNPVVGLAKAG